MLAAGKIMLLILVAVFKNGELDSDAYVFEGDQAACIAAGPDAADAWKARDPRIAAIQAACEERDDPRPFLYMRRPDLIPAPDADPMPREGDPPHAPGKDQASLHEKDNGRVEGHGG